MPTNRIDRSDPKNFLKTYLELKNLGLKNKEIASKMGYKSSTFSRKINKFFEQGLLRHYYNVLLDRLMSKTRIYIVSLNQRISLDHCLPKLKHYKPTVTYYSPLPRPTYILYYVAYPYTTPSENDFDLEKCSLESYGIVEDTALIKENSFARTFSLIYSRRDYLEYGRTEFAVDEVDDFIARAFFRLFNPPMIGNNVFNLLVNSIYKYISINTFKHHYYTHLYNKVIYKRIVYREPSTYSIILTRTTSLEKLEELHRTLYSRDIIVGIDQINILSDEPVEAISHCWIREDNLWSHSLIHKDISDTRYDIYPVIALGV